MPMAPQTPMTPARPAIAGAGRFADRWQQRTKDGQGVTAARPLTEEERKSQRLLHSKRKYALSTALDKGTLDEAVEAAEDLLSQGQSIPHDLLYRLICTAADSPGVERFAKVVNICTQADLRFDVMEWASLVGRLMARDAPHAQVRIVLNFGLQKDGKVMELIPPDANRQSDIEKCFAGAEHLDIGELSDEDDIATALHASSASGLRPPPKALSFSGCSWKKLNGTYTKCRKKDWESKLSKKPVYKKLDGLGDKFPSYVYYYEFDETKKQVKKEKAEGEKEEEEEAWKSGWYIGTEVGGGGTTYAYCDEDASEIPPTFANWHIINNKGQREEFLGFERIDRGNVQSAKVVEWEEAQEHLTMVDLDLLPGRVTGEDPEVTKYFNHFFILLHLEQLAEVAGFRGRFGFRRAEELASFGIALIDTELEGTWGYTDESRRMALPGWPEVGQEKVSFKLPRVMNVERFGIKRGESVLISRGDPLKSRVTEGSVIDVDLMTRLLIVNINGKFPNFDNSARFRLDCYANRTTFERQLTALLQFITMKRTKMQEMLIAAGVGRVDLAVLGGDGFIDPSEGTKLAERKKKDEAAAEARKKKNRAAAAPAKVVISDEVLEQADDGQDFGEDGTWVNVEVNEVDEEEEVEVEESEEEEAPRTAEDVIARRLAREMEETQEDRAKRLARELEEDLDHFPEAKPLEALPSTGAPQAAGVSAEEQIKRNTLALANEDAEGIDPERLECATEMVQTLPDLSKAQRNALANSLSKRLTIVQGPPGTGKTHTSVRILTMWAKQMRYTPLLATSECNIAVDNIAEGLAKAGVKVVRIGRPEKVRDVLEPVCLDNMVKADREQRARENEEEESDIEELGEEPWDEKSPEHKEWEELRQKWRRKRAWDRKQDAFARARFVEAAEVLCATTVTAGSQALAGYKFRAILIDEVAQATETSAIVPIVCRGAQQIALCGDHCQLPPSTVSREAELRGMSLSLYSRLVEAGVPFQFLDTQYRAHPALMEFSATCIYQGRLKNGIDGSQRPVPKGIPWPNPQNPAAFFASEQAEGLNGESKDNPGEADMVVNLVCEVLKHKEITLNDIGIVTPYKGQVRTLRVKLFKKFPEAQKSRELEIASVDNFQGREKELIIFSAVRCNDMCRVGFLNDWRRLNVMITRARRGLVVIGNAATLVCDKHWRMWLQFTEKQGGCAKGTVEQAIKEAHTKLDLLGKPNYKKRIFPQSLDDMLSSTPGVGEDIRKAKEKAALAKMKKKEKKQDDGKARYLDYLELEQVFEELDEEMQEEGDEQEVDTWGILSKTKEAKNGQSKATASTPAETNRPSSKRKAEDKPGEEAWEDGEWEEDWVEDAGGAARTKKAEPKKAKASGGEVGGKKPTTKAKPSTGPKATEKSWEEWDGEDWEEEAAPAKPSGKAKGAAKAKPVVAKEDDWEEEEAWEEPWEEEEAPEAKVKAKAKAKTPVKARQPSTKLAKASQAKEAPEEDAEWDDAAWEAWEAQEQVAQPAKKKARPSAAPSKEKKEEKEEAEVEVEIDTSYDAWGLLSGKAPRLRGL